MVINWSHNNFAINFQACLERNPQAFHPKIGKGRVRPLFVMCFNLYVWVTSNVYTSYNGFEWDSENCVLHVTAIVYRSDLWGQMPPQSSTSQSSLMNTCMQEPGFIKWVINQAWGTCKAGIILAKFIFACLWMKKSWGPQKCKKEQGQYPAMLTEKAWKMKDFFLSGIFSSGTQQVVTSRQNSITLPARVAGHSTAWLGSSSPLMKLAINTCRTCLS